MKHRASTAQRSKAFQTASNTIVLACVKVVDRQEDSPQLRIPVAVVDEIDMDQPLPTEYTGIYVDRLLDRIVTGDEEDDSGALWNGFQSITYPAYSTGNFPDE